MNYDEARQDKNGIWRWTTMNDGRIRTAPPCIQFEEQPIEEIGRVPSKVLGMCEHATKEEAERHFYDDCLDRVKESESSHWMDCAVCGAPTKKLLGNRPFGVLFSEQPLCDDHFSKETLAELHPFSTGIYLMHS